MKFSWFLVFVFCFQLSASTQDPGQSDAVIPGLTRDPEITENTGPRIKSGVTKLENPIALTQDSAVQVLKYMIAASSIRLAVETTCPQVMIPLAVLTTVSSFHDSNDSWMPWVLGSATWFGSVLWRSKDPRFSF